MQTAAFQIEELYRHASSTRISLILDILTFPQLIEAEQQTSKHWELTTEGTQIVNNGSHEAAVYNAIPTEGISQAELMVNLWGHHLTSICDLCILLSYL